MNSLRIASACLVALALCAGCAEDDTPSAALVVEPSTIQRGQPVVEAVLVADLDPTGAFLASASFGDDIDMLRFEECTEGEVPAEFAVAAPYRVCVTLSLGADASLGERAVSIELRIDGERVAAEGTLVVTE